MIQFQKLQLTIRYLGAYGLPYYNWLGSFGYILMLLSGQCLVANRSEPLMTGFHNVTMYKQ